MEIGYIGWLSFLLFLVLMLAIDLGIFNRKSHEITYKEALLWSGIWISISLLFNIGIFNVLGHQKGMEFLTGYLLEKSLSVDNIFVFVLLFSFFNVPNKYQHKVLFYGIVGALIMRGVLIALGAALIMKFHWVLLLFGAFLIFSGIRMAIHKEEKIEPEKNPVVKFFKKIFPVTKNYENGKFFVKKSTGLLATPLFIVLIIVETTDLVFAFDSIPAILAITQDTFIVFTSNAFAILGLRSLYFALAGFMDKFRFLRTGLSFILIFIGIKMMIDDLIHIPVSISLIVIVIVLTISILASIYVKRKKS